MITRKTTPVLAFLFSSMAFNLYGYTVTITLNSSVQTVNLGAYGSGVTAIHFLCAASASTYYWTIGGDWVSTSGATQETTSTGSWTVVPTSGMTGCATGEVSVSGTGTSGGGGGGGLRMMPNTTTGSFQFIGYISFSSPHLSPTNIQQYNGSGPSQFQCTVSGVDTSIPASNYSWGIPSGSSFLTFDPVTAGLVYISYPPASSFVSDGNGGWVATGSVSVAITIPNGAQCNTTLVSNIRVEDNTAGGPGPSCFGTSTCYFVEDNGDMVEVECGKCISESVRKGYSFFPNPVEKEFTVKFSNTTTPTTISLLNEFGGIIGTRKGTNENITWDTSGLPSGIYFLKIDDGAKVNTERILLKK
ncbi:MAG TPA: T9SS type A sorting domain-containing protein [Cyclobacteriaceae bacterium]|jgi:hypothetical protein|nr:T9SS type A sorting domain-containing protein [Cyclobacteriaceae bacterium]